MKYDDQLVFLQSLDRPRMCFGIRIDLSRHPEWFGRLLQVEGLYIYGRAKSPESLKLSSLKMEIVLFNETDRTKINLPEDFHHSFQIRDLQEFPYIAAVRPIKPEKKR